MTNAPAIQTKQLSKTYEGEIGQKSFTALDGLNLSVQKGEVFAFLGPNGAGKSTTIKLLTRLIEPTKGSIELFGVSHTERRSRIPVGFLPEQPNLYGYLTGRELLDFVGRIFGMSRSDRRSTINRLVDLVGLGKRATERIRGYSRGMVQRLALAQALINDPKLLILDEPMANLDPIGRRNFRDLILNFKKEGKTIFFSSHILSDAELIADRVGIIRSGLMINTGKLDDLIRNQVSVIEVTCRLESDQLKKIYLEGKSVEHMGDKVLIRLNDEDDLHPLIRQIDSAGGRILACVPQRKTLEDLFMKELGRAL